ncbi:MAG: heme-copper oxidase subunit III [Candidatus Omnitrophica bacterium]|nr:heme-copper oxidase subunit III [Candidatus Omnitrophota bacterium]
MDRTVSAHVEHPLLDIPVGKFGMWVFLISEIMFFTGLIGSYVVLRLGSVDWLRPGNILNTMLLGLNTIVLLSSSLTMALGLNAIQQGRQRALKRNLLLTALLGVTFLAIKGYDYLHMWHRGFTMSSSLFGSCYYLLTGFHALHVLSGVILLGYLFTAASRGMFSAANYGRIEYSGLYWHFVDIVWVILFAILCLV